MQASQARRKKNPAAKAHESSASVEFALPKKPSVLAGLESIIETPQS
jgi:hypothetical protein